MIAKKAFGEQVRARSGTPFQGGGTAQQAARPVGRRSARRGADVDAYAKEVIASDFEEAGDEDVLRKVSADSKDGGVAVTDEEIRAKMRELLALAAEQIQAE